MISDRPPRATVLLLSGARVVARLLVPGTTRCDLLLVDRLLRLRLNAGRLGWRFELIDVAADLGELFELVGLGVEPGDDDPGAG